jgi:hypothetical protein
VHKREALIANLVSQAKAAEHERMAKAAK